MNLPNPLVRAVITACLAEITDQPRRELMATSDVVRASAEDGIADRIMDALNQCGSVNALEPLAR